MTRGGAKAFSRLLSLTLAFSIGAAPTAPAWAQAAGTTIPTAADITKEQGTLAQPAMPPIDMTGVMTNIPECTQSSIAGFSSAGVSLSSLMDPSGLSCSDLKGKGAKLIKDYQDAADAAVTKAKAAESEITCAQKSLEALNGILKSYEGKVQEGLTGAQAQAKNANDWMEDTQAKMKFIDEEVQGPLVEAKNLAEKYNSGYPALVSTFSKQIKTFRSTEKGIVQEKQMIVMQSAMKCFKEEQSADTPCRNADGSLRPASAYEHAICVYQREVLVGPNGRFQAVQANNNAALAKMATAKASAQSLFDKMISSVPDPSKWSADPNAKGAQPLNISSFQNMTPADLERSFSNELSALSQVGTTSQSRTIPLKQFVLGKIQNCYNRQKTAAEKLEGEEFGPIATKTRALEQQKSDMQAGMQTAFADAQSLWEKMMSATGRRGDALEKMDLSKCDNADPEGQLSCMQTIRANVNGMLTGGSAFSKRPLQIRGTKADGTIAFTCDGLNACLNSVKNLRTNLNTSLKTQDQNLKQFKQQFSANFQTGLRNAAQNVANLNQAIRARIAGVKSSLASLGVNKDVRYDKVQKQAIQTGPDGLPVMPDNLEATLGGMVNPPVAGIDERSLAEMREAVDEKLTSAKKKVTDVRSHLAECREKTESEITASKNKLNELGCKNQMNWCESGPLNLSMSSIYRAMGQPLPENVEPNFRGQAPFCTKEDDTSNSNWDAADKEALNKKTADRDAQQGRINKLQIDLNGALSASASAKKDSKEKAAADKKVTDFKARLEAENMSLNQLNTEIATLKTQRSTDVAEKKTTKKEVGERSSIRTQCLGVTESLAKNETALKGFQLESEVGTGR